MPIPSVFPEWASDTISESTEVGSVDNKLEPSEAFKDSGLLYKQPLPYPFINYQFNLIDEWQRSLHERAIGYEVGELYMTTGATTIGALATRFGGTWTSRGTDTIAGQVTNVYERTA